MKTLPLALMVVGLCFYEAYLLKNGLPKDTTAGFIAFIGALIVLFNF